MDRPVGAAGESVRCLRDQPTAPRLYDAGVQLCERARASALESNQRPCAGSSPTAPPPPPEWSLLTVGFCWQADGSFLGHLEFCAEYTARYSSARYAQRGIHIHSEVMVQRGIVQRGIYEGPHYTWYHTRLVPRVAGTTRRYYTQVLHAGTTRRYYT